jgi:hypothetical protein
LGSFRISAILRSFLLLLELNRRWYQANSGQVLMDVQRHIRHPALRWMAATLEATGAIFEALPWSFSEEAAAEKYMAQLQHNMWVVAARIAAPFGDHWWRQMGRDHHPCRSALSASHRHGRAQVLALCRERRAPSPLWRGAAKPRIEAVRIVDMGASNSWAEFAGLFRSTRQPFLDHERSKAELKALVPEDTKQALGHGVRAKVKVRRGQL